MRYVLSLHARPSELESIGVKHNRLIYGLSSITTCWGLPPGNYPVPDIGKELSTEFPIGRFLGNGIKGRVWYRYRGKLRDESACDDYIYIEFNPKRVDYKDLIEIALPIYIESFGPYWSYIGDEEFGFIDFDISRNFNHRDNVIRIYPVNYFDQELCKRAFGLDTLEVLERVRDHVDNVQLIGNGVLIIVRATTTSIEEAETMNTNLNQVLM